MFRNLVQKGNAHNRKARGRILVVLCIMAITILAMSVTAFAAYDPDDLSSVAITTEQVAPIVDLIVANVAAIMPVGIPVLGIMIGVGIVPRVIRRFTSA